MTQKVLKPLFLLMISWAVTGITFFGCNPIALAWYSAGNILPVFGVVIAPGEYIFIRDFCQCASIQ